MYISAALSVFFKVVSIYPILSVSSNGSLMFLHVVESLALALYFGLGLGLVMGFSPASDDGAVGDGVSG